MSDHLIGAWDSPAVARQTASMLDADDAAFERAAEMFFGYYMSGVQAGDAEALAPWAGRRYSTGKIQTVGDVVFGSLDRADFCERMSQILIDAANGRGVQGAAFKLLEEAGKLWADDEASRS